MQYKKSLLSLATIVALNTTAMADPVATYVPLTTKTHDRAWVMFGVNEFSNGTPSDTENKTSTFTAGYSKVIDPIGDDLKTEGFPDGSGKSMGSVQALSNDVTGFTANPIVAIKSSDLTFSETEPERTMYISIVDANGNGGDIAKIKLNYKASLEGREIEIEINGDTSTIYKTKVSQTATYSNPAPAANTPPVASIAPKLSKVDDVLVYDLSDAPILATAYSKAKHQYARDINAPEGLERFYHYDAANQKWLLWDRSKTGTAGNDFTNFTKGEAYWGRVDLKDGSATPTTGNKDNNRSIAGLILGKDINSSYADPSVYAGKLTPDSWNMISFDPANNPDIRNAATGMIVDLSSLGDGDHVTITDETGVNTVTIPFTTADTADRESIAKHINTTIEAEKFSGKLPSTFNVKAFATDADDATVLISDKKFTIKDPDGKIGGATTLTGGDVFEEASQTVTTVTDVDAAGATSIYGEFAMVIEPLVGAGTASELDATDGHNGNNYSARVQFGTIDGDSKNGGNIGTPVTLGDNDTDTDITTAAGKFANDDVFTTTNTPSKGKVTQLDSDFDGTTDMVVAASTVPFYIKDNTYTRVYSYHKVDSNSSFTIKAAANTIVDVDANSSVGDVNSTINDQADTGSATGVYASVDGNNLVVVSSDQRTFSLLDADSATVNYFNSTTSSKDIAKGAVKRVINIEKLARASVNTEKFTIDMTANAAGDGVDHLKINDINATDTDTIDTSSSSDADIVTMLDSIVSKANKLLKDNNISAHASHNYSIGDNDFTRAKIVVEGYGLTSVSMDENDTGLTSSESNNSTTADLVSLAGTTITDDLKDNAVYTPDYVNYGPLYTLKEAGYEAKVIIRPSTDITAATTHWDAIDLTRNSSDWLKHNEFNLFNVDNRSGYWVYLTSYTDPQSITINNPVYQPYYSHHFINDGGANDGKTENIIDGGQFSVEITGINEATSNVKAIVAGKEIELTREGGTGDTYSAIITSFETNLAPSASPIEIGVRATDGVGEALDVPAVVTFDYTKPATPTVSFNNAVEATFSDSSTDVVNYYLYENFVPDNLASPFDKNISVATAAAYKNICAKTSFANDPVADKHNFKLIAVDGQGDLRKANGSDVKSFTYVNLTNGATVVTHTAGDAASTITAYDTNCDTTTANTGGLDITSLSGSVKMSFVSLGHNISNGTDVPWTVFYDLNGDGHENVKVSMIAAYAGHRIYIQKGTNIYTAILPATEAEADASVNSAPIDISTPIQSDNKTLAGL